MNLNPLNLIPVEYKALALAGVAVAVVTAAFGTGWTVNGWRLNKDFQVKITAAEMARAAIIEQNAEDSAKLQKEKDDAIAKAKEREDELAAAIDRAAAAHTSLLKSTDAAVARARKACNRASASAGVPPADDPIGVLADVLGRADTRAGALAKYAQSAHDAGVSCEAQYESVRKTLNP